MDLDGLPLQMEVMGWNPQTLADFMRKLKLSGCDKVVMKGNITGAQFMLMTELELQGFPGIHVPMITKIQSDIHSGGRQERKKSFGMRLKESMFPKKVLENDAWDSDEFDNGSDKDYDDTKQSESEDDESSCDYEMPSSEHRDKVDTGQSDSESSSEDTPHNRPPSLPPPRPKQSPLGRAITPNVRFPPVPRRDKAPPTPAWPHFERSKKPHQLGPPKEDLSKPKEGNNITYSGVASNPQPWPRTLKPKKASCNSFSRVRRAAVVPTKTQTFANLKPEPEQGLDPGWYGGKLTRRQAEVTLQQMNKDGAFVVRDSSRGSTEHPYTLMVFKEGKVYNIKITSNGDSYSLGTNPKRSQRYPAVREMIAYYTHNPLLLIDATDQRSGAHSQCCLLHPVGI